MSKKKIFNVLFVILCFVLTLYYVFHGEDLTSIFAYMKKANSIYWLVGIVFVILFILSEAFVIHYLLKALKYKVSLFHCCLYSFVGFFFSCITPSASGGQPAQAVFMKKDNIPVSASTITLLIITISYKAVLLLYGGIIIIFEPAVIMHYLDPIMPVVHLGMWLNSGVVLFMLLLAIKPKLTEKMVMSIFNLVAKIAKSNKVDTARDNAEQSMDNYVTKSEFLITHKKLMLKVLAMTFVQRTILFLITFLVCLSFDSYEIGIFDVTMLQGAISIAVDMLPLPGGMGASEVMFKQVFTPVVGKDLSIPVMIVSRGLSYYTQIIISAIMTLVAYIRFYGFSFWRKEKQL